MEKDHSERMVRMYIVKQEVNLQIVFLNEGIPELLRVNLITYYPVFQNSEADCRNFKVCYHLTKSIKKFFLRL